jgi:hypothetical protein
MDIQIDTLLTRSIKAPEVKKAWLSDNKPLRSDDCPNCGGLGFHAVFVAVAGPFKTPAAPYSGKSSKYWQGSWWVGGTYTAPCPVCGGDKTPKNKIRPANPGI